MECARARWRGAQRPKMTATGAQTHTHIHTDGYECFPARRQRTCAGERERAGAGVRGQHRQLHGCATYICIMMMQAVSHDDGYGLHMPRAARPGRASRLRGALTL
eukprot:scaffold2655_cov400-Prasinococcus_capsulatus_cf.AAC.4